MLCPQCRRQVGRDGYCPQGHLAAPERAAPVEPAFYAPSPSATTAPPMPGAPPLPGAPPPVPPEGGPPAPKAPRRPVVVALAFLLLVVGVLGFIAFGPTASAANLKYVFANGEKHRYLLDMTFDISAGNLAFGGIAMKGRMEMLMNQTTTSVKDGVATIRYEVEKILVTEGRTRANIPIPDTALTVKMAPDGKVIDADGSGLLELGSADPVSNLTGMIGPESFGPVLPDHKVDPGQSWEISERMANPFGDTIDFRGTGQLVERKTVDGREIAVIKSDTNTPFNFDLSFDDLAELAGEANDLGDGRMTFNGFFSTNLTQSFATGSGFLKSVIGDVKLTGTLSIEGVPQLGPGQNSAVMNMLMNITMTEVP
jgi:hypothetical protein